MRVYVEAGKRRVFAGAIDWPGWCRSARDERAALQALFDYAPRYASAIGRARQKFSAPSTVSGLKVVERWEGDATTDFGAPSIAPSADAEAVDPSELKRLSALLKVCWSYFDSAAEAASGAVLRKGPRGGGREVDAVVAHVREADVAYLSKLGGRFHRAGGRDLTAGLRETILETLALRARGEPLPQPSRARTLWTPRFVVRRSAWHALDHAWEIEDRATTS